MNNPSHSGQLSAIAVATGDILEWRELFRQEMRCQIVHDSLHARDGWTQSFLLKAGSTAVGYGSVAIAGPWRGTKTVFEFFVATEHRPLAFALFEIFAEVAGVTAFEVQTNDVLLTLMLHNWCRAASSEKIVFERKIVTALPSHEAIFRRALPQDSATIFPHRMEPVGDWLLESGGMIAATGGVLYHYNRPYGDLYLEVAPAFRCRGLGSYLLQELARVCTEGGSVPCARCDPANFPSRKALQKAGFSPVAHILIGPFSR